MTNEEAIIELRDLISDDRTDKENKALLIAIEALRNERPHGKWLTTWDRYIFQCSCCHGKCVKYNFCPECGADMRGEEGGRQ